MDTQPTLSKGSPASPDSPRFGEAGERASRGGPKDVFLNLLVTITLYVSVISFLTLLFQYINIGFPDRLEGDYWVYTSIYDKIRLATAALFVMFGVYLFLSWVMAKSYRTNFALRELRSRKWLVNLTLFASALTIIIDLIFLINNFLRGELTARFGLKVLAILIVSACVFAYYYWDIKKEAVTSSKSPKALAWASSAVVLITILVGFFIAGSPAEQRRVRFDEQRLNALQSVQGEIINYWQLKRELPRNPEQLSNDFSGFRAPVDPKTNQPYDYIVTGDLTFKLCAEFETEQKGSFNSSRASYPLPVYGPYNQNWEHGKGKVCFDRTIDPSLYPARSEEIMKR